MSKFITNQEELLSDVANDILPTTKTLKFLVGYFYFSGFKEIYENIEDKDLKILVGLDAQKGVSATVQEVESIEFDMAQKQNKKSKSIIRQEQLENLKNIINNTDLLEDEEGRQAFRVFVDKIADGTLEIRKTKDPNHAKLYIFKNKDSHSQNGQQPGTIITGSSNLTLSGLRNNFEINIQIREEDTFNEASDMFDQLWSESIPIVSQETLSEFEEEVVDQIWVDKVPDPYLVYLRVLSEYFSSSDHSNPKSPAEINDDYINLRYQLDAIKDGIEGIKRHNGAIIADVVGLGKSIIAAAIAHNLGLRTVVIAPPHLTDQWDGYQDDFNFSASVRSSGKIEQAYEDFNDDHDRLIIVDEAHAYRNEDTDAYGNLHKLCQGNKVLLLSATPFNNRPEDIFSLIKLFQIPGRSTIRTVSSLSHRFRALVKKYKKITKSQREDRDTDTTKYVNKINEITDQIKSVLDPVIIRRSRIDLKERKEYREDLERQNIEFPEVMPPEVLDYELGGLTDRYEETLEKLAITRKEEGFIGARYKPTSYIPNFEAYRARIKEEYDKADDIKQAQRNNATFMKRLLVRRFESSIPAFFSTLNSIQSSSQLILDWLDERGEVPVYKKGKITDLSRFEQTTGESIESAIEEEIVELKDKGMQIIKKDELDDKFRPQLKGDIELLEEIKEMWVDIPSGKTKDPKLESLKDLLKEKLEEDPDRKIIIFTEYNDTAEWVKSGLENDFRVFKYSSSDASVENKRTINENFDAGAKNPANEYDVLVATDAISEGYNLNRAGIVFNYDIPYNPTRVIQRVGRINRINKKVFDNLYIYNSFPSATGERETRTKQIATLKMSMIQALLGEDTKFLTSDEEPRAYGSDIDAGISKYQDKTEAEVKDSETSWDTKYLNALDIAKSEHPELLEKAQNLPDRIRIGRKITDDTEEGVLLCSKKAGDFAFGFQSYNNTDNEVISLTAEDALKLFSATQSEKAFQESNDFELTYKNLRQNLFLQNEHTPNDSTTGETVNIVTALADRAEFKDQKSYLDDLTYVIKELDSLPDRYMKNIRSMEMEDDKIKESFKELQVNVPSSYLSGLREQAREISEGEEEVIVSEEFKHEF
jgi:superfamily II DNA/RNA helicase